MTSESDWQHWQLPWLGGRNFLLQGQADLQLLLKSGSPPALQHGAIPYPEASPTTSNERVTSLLAHSGEDLLKQRLDEIVRSVAQPSSQTESNTNRVVPLPESSSFPQLAGKVGQETGNFFLKGLTLAPLLGGLLGLFRNNEAEEHPEPVRFQLPAALRTEAALAPDGQMVAIDRGAGDAVRTLRPLHNLGAATVQSYPERPTTESAPAQITIQVNAMDSRSFLDHSEDIARAVRDAMLHSHALNDVVSDL